jgi:AcrR family transcriptional regulator
MIDNFDGYEQKGLITRTFRRLDPEKRNRVIAAILAESAEAGPASLNIKNVAARAGVAVGALYTYFTNREGLLDFAVELVTEQVVQHFRQYGDVFTSMPLKFGFKWLVKSTLEWAEANPGLAQFYLRAAYDDHDDLHRRVVEPVSGTLLGILREMVMKAGERGEIRAGVDLEALARVLHALAIAAADPILLPHLHPYFKMVDGECGLDRLLSSMTEVLMRGISA